MKLYYLRCVLNNPPGLFAYKSLQAIPSPKTVRPPMLPSLQFFLFDLVNVTALRTPPSLHYMWPLQ